VKLLYRLTSYTHTKPEISEYNSDIRCAAAYIMLRVAVAGNLCLLISTDIDNSSRVSKISSLL
jgi:hypothetical protein